MKAIDFVAVPVTAVCLLAIAFSGFGNADQVDSEQPPMTQTGVGASHGRELASDPVGWSIQDLAGRLAVAPDTIEVITRDQVTWRNGSLGCPRPGMLYTQALVDGVRIILASDGAQYAYHSAAGGSPFYCPDPQPPLPE